MKTTEVNTEILQQLLELSEAILNGDYSKRVVADFKDDTINQIIDNLNRHADSLLLTPREIKNNETTVNSFIDTISSFANHDFGRKLPVSEYATILDAIATGINMLGEELEQSTASKIELNNSLNMVTEQNKRLLNFSYIVSHNLRSHAGNIKSLLGLLENARSEGEKKKIIRHMETTSTLLNETMVHLHEVVSIQKSIDLIIEPIRLHEYINNAIEVLSEQISLKKATIENNVSKDILINYNPAYLESIILNFLSNALKYSHPNRQPYVSVCFVEADNQKIIEISDNGIGIDLEKHNDKLFGMYKTFHGNKDARGIGLFITKNQVEAMGGKIEVKSKVGIGTLFRIYMK